MQQDFTILVVMGASIYPHKIHMIKVFLLIECFGRNYCIDLDLNVMFTASVFNRLASLNSRRFLVLKLKTNSQFYIEIINKAEPIIILAFRAILCCTVPDINDTHYNRGGVKRGKHGMNKPLR